jgi:hypothetical protein
MNNDLIQPTEVARDENGWWSHPGIPDFEEDQAAFNVWMVDQGLESTYKLLTDEPDDHLAYIAYFEHESASCTGWEPQAPLGEGWFTFSIHDTEDGPAWVWVRRTAAQAATQDKE